MISHAHRCIFVHIPKTAGKSINRAFGISWEEHKDILRYSQELDPSLFESYFKFAIVRNPWERLVSEYNFQKQKRRNPESKLFLFDHHGSMRSFPDWVRIALSNPFQHTDKDWGGDVSSHIHRWSPQCDWIRIGQNVAVDFVAHLENLARDFQTICGKLGLPQTPLPHRNRKLHWHYSRYYDPATRDLVADYYARDIKEFGYSYADCTGVAHVSVYCLREMLSLLRSLVAR